MRTSRTMLRALVTLLVAIALLTMRVSAAGGGAADPSVLTRAEHDEDSALADILQRAPGTGLWAAGSAPAGSLPDDLVDVQYPSVEHLAPGSQEAQDRQRQAVQELGLPLEVRTRKTGIVLRLVPAGTFVMGSPTSEPFRFVGEVQHEVTLSKAFYCGKYEVTQAQWQQVMGSNPSYFQNAGANAPAEQVSWDDCQVFTKNLCLIEGVPEGTYRFLTEEEWEYAARAGTQTVFCYGDDLDATMANFNGNYPYGNGSKGPNRQTTIPVGSFLPNAWGLYDMHGNVSEWCQDRRPLSKTYPPPELPGVSEFAIFRGGAWSNMGRPCRSASALVLLHTDRENMVGLRIARTTP